MNAGTYAFAAAPLPTRSSGLSNDNAQGEYYLGDVLPLIREAGRGRRSPTRSSDPSVNLGVNDRVQLAQRERGGPTDASSSSHMRAGVTIVDPAATWIDAEVELAPDVTIEPGHHPARRHQRRRRLGDRPDDAP